MYRKGVKDSADVGSLSIIDAFLLENDATKDFRFIFDENGKVLKLNYYAAVLTMNLVKVSGSEAAVLLDFNRASQNMRRGAAALAFAYYRKGLEEGCRVDIAAAADYFLEDKYFKVHNRMNGLKLSTVDMIEDMRLEAMRLDTEDFGGGYAIWKFITEALSEHYAREAYLSNNPPQESDL